MIVKYSYSDNILKFHYYAEERDPLEYRGIKLGRDVCEFRLPSDWDISMVHPDLLALSMILVIYPFAGNQIVLPVGVSKLFHDYFKAHTKKDILPINYKLEPRKIPEDGVPGLAYSGGLDSTAALTLLPRTTVSVFLDRIIPQDANSMYNKEAAHDACKYLRELGRSVYMIETDLEYVRVPVGFPIDVANAVPALLLSDYIGLDSIAFGTEFIGAYTVFKPRFQDYKSRLHYKRWGKIFEIAGMPFNLVTSGITTYGTTKIAANSPYFDFAQSCMRGGFKHPCMDCIRCFRKKPIEVIVLGKDLNEYISDEWFKVYEGKLALSRCPADEELSYAYITSHYKGNNTLMNLLKKKTRGDILDMSWFEKWYEPSIEMVCEKYREYVRNQMLKYLDKMSESDIQNMKNLDAEKALASQDYIDNHNKFMQELNKLQ